jgi:hypothetical protein
MTMRIAEVSAEAERTGAQATEVQGSTEILAASVVDLKHAVIATVRATSEKVNQRSARAASG